MNLDSLMELVQEAMNKATVFLQNFDFFRAEHVIQEAFRQASDKALGDCMSNVLACPFFRRTLRDYGHTVELQVHEYYPITVELSNGTSVQVTSPYFVRKQTKGRRKPGPKPAGSTRKGAHFALDLWGFFGKKSPALAFKGFRNAALCPSYDTALYLLQDDGIVMSENWLRDHLKPFSDLTPQQRADMGCAAGESFKGKRVVVEVDGGRYRERTPRKGRIPARLKRRGYDSSWREPRLLTIFAVTETGEPEKGVPYHVDGTTGDLQDFLALLEAYSQRLDISEAAEVLLVSDGAPWIWDNVPELLKTMGLPDGRLTELMDYTHAKQNLLKTIDLCSFAFEYQRERFVKDAKDLLYAGDVESLKSECIARAARGCKREIKAKFNKYFRNNEHRFGYEQAEGRWPLGSGAVESSIRRVLNMRIKAPGSHWGAIPAETIIFLRSKLLTGRWNTLRSNWLQFCRGHVMDFVHEEYENVA